MQVLSENPFTIHWGDVLVSTILSVGTGIGLAWYFRFRVKPKFEIVYDDNRRANIKLILNNIEWFDSEFQSIYEIIERDLGELTEEREAIVPRPQFIPRGQLEKQEPIDPGLMTEINTKLQEIRTNLKPSLDRMRERFNSFLKEYSIYHNYLHDSFLRDVRNYFMSTLDYAKFLLNGENYYGIGIKRKHDADKIIEYLENDKSLDKTDQTISRFISKWKGWKPKEKTN